MIRRVLFSLLITGVLGGTAAQAASPGTTGAQFLRINIDPRAAGMGGAYTALAEGPEATHWNPAGLGPWNPRNEPGWIFAAEHIERFEDVNFEHLALSRTFADRWGVGLSVKLLRTQDTRRAAPGGVLGDFSNSDLAVGLSLGRTIGDIDVGLTYRRIESRLADERASANAIDVGLKYHLGERWTLATTVRNFGDDLVFFQVGDPLPTEFRAGVSYQAAPRVGRNHPLYTLSADFIQPRELDPRASIGGEIRPLDFLALRAGYLANADAASQGVSAGIGVTVQNVSMDYAYEPFGDLGEVHRLGLRFDFTPRAGAPTPNELPPERQLLPVPTGSARPLPSTNRMPIVPKERPALTPKVPRERKR